MVGLIRTLLVVLIGMGGCPSPQVGFDSSAPNKRLDAIAQAGQEDDQESRVQLVEKLGSSDPAERMLAIRALERREGTTLEYEHAAPRWERLEAIERWRAYIGLSGHENGDDEGQDDSPMRDEINDSGVDSGINNSDG